MHCWGDKGVDWQGISDAAEYIGESLAKWARIYVAQYKEKFGTVRVYCHFGWNSLHDIIYPGYHYNQFPKWFTWFDYKIATKFLFVLNYLVVPFHKWYYRRTYIKAIKKWPHLEKEILAGMDFSILMQDYINKVFPKEEQDKDL
jgi:hypothetical protein